jgi:FKBP-type peptidyl-prolyl cis-trans isomerase
LKNAFVVLGALLLAACAAPGERAPPSAAATPPAPKCAPAPETLVVRDAQQGRGDPITFRTAVMVPYTGWLYDPCAAEHKGAMFDTSTTRGVPFGLVVGAGRVIKGWDEGLIGMREGGKRVLVIPPGKAYGAAGSGGGKIPPNATLVFEIELLRVLERPQPQPRSP